MSRLVRRAGGGQPGKSPLDLGQGAAGGASVVLEGDSGVLGGGVVDDLPGAGPACLVVGGWRGTGEEADDRRTQCRGGVDVLAELQSGLGVAEEGGLRGVCNQQAGAGDAAGGFGQFGIEPWPSLPAQFQAVGAGLAGNVDQIPDGNFRRS